MGSQWWVNTQPGPSAPGGATVGGGGYGTQVVSYRSDLDARRSMAGQDSAYPDGYLGTITDRHQDKLLQAVQDRLNERSYQRGVHVGSRIGREQYYWNDEVNPDMGIARQAQAVVVDNGGAVLLMTPRFAPTLNPAERLAHMGKDAGLSPAQMDGVARQYDVEPGKKPTMNPDPGARSKMQQMLPRTVL